MISNKSIGKAITYYRESKELNMIELAKRAGISQGSVSLYENGKRTPSEKAIDKLSKALEVHPQELTDKAREVESQEPSEPQSYNRYDNKASGFIYNDDNNNNNKEDYRLRRLQMFERNNDLLIHFTKSLICGVNIKFADLDSSNRRNRASIHKRRNDSINSAVAEQVFLDFIHENSDELAERFDIALKELGTTVDEVIKELRDDDDYYY